MLGIVTSGMMMRAVRTRRCRPCRMPAMTAVNGMAMMSAKTVAVDDMAIVVRKYPQSRRVGHTD